MSLFDEAKAYLHRGWSVVPIKPGEKRVPEGFSWINFQDHLPSMKDLELWSRWYPSAGIGLVTGKVSGVIVVDADGPSGIRSLKRLKLIINCNPIVLTPSGGAHVYFSHPGFRVNNYVKSLKGLPGIDIRGDGGLAVLPSSVHQNYEWFVDPCIPSLLPDFLAEVLQRNPEQIPSQKKLPKHEAGIIAEGSRNTTVFRLACSFAQNTRNKDHLYKRVQGLNEKNCHPPLGEGEVKKIVDNAWAYRQSNHGR